MQLLPIRDELLTRYAGAHLPWWVLAALFVATDLCALEIRASRLSTSFTMAEVPVLMGIRSAAWSTSTSRRPYAGPCARPACPRAR